MPGNTLCPWALPEENILQEECLTDFGIIGL